MPAASSYYLTILTPEAISEISDTVIDPNPETLIRRYFAIYPTETPVLTAAGLDYPEVELDQGFTVRDYGEIIITPDMFVLWQ